MGKYRKIYMNKGSHNKTIYFFEVSDRNPLNEYISFLKHKDIFRSSRFTFANPKGSIIEHLTIKENIILDAIQQSIIINKEDDLISKISSLENEYLKSLINRFKDLDKSSNLLNRTDKMILSLIKSLLSQTDYIFIDFNDIIFDCNTRNIVKLAITYEVNNRNRKVFLNSKKKEPWVDIVTSYIYRDHEKSFKQKDNKIYQDQEVKHSKFKLVG